MDERNANRMEGTTTTGRARRGLLAALVLALAVACPATRPAQVTPPGGETGPGGDGWTEFRSGATPENPPVADVAEPVVDVPMPVAAPEEPGDKVEGGLQTSLLGQLELAAGARSGLRVVVERETTLVDAEPLKGADVWVALGKGRDARTLYHGRTDASGSVDVEFRVPESATGDSLLTVHVADPTGGAKATHARAVKVARAARVLLTTDKPMYQPGQTIHLRALALDPRRTGARAGVPVSFVIEDAKGNKLFRKTANTSAQGVVSLDFPIASQVNTGTWKISLANAGGAVLAEKSVTVEHYVLPKFQVGVTFDRPYYAPGEVVSGTVNARYFFGKPVAGGRVKVEAAVFDVERHVFATLQGTTDADGVYGFELRLPEVLAGSELEAGNARVLLDTTVTDTAEHEQTDHGSVVVAKDPVALLLMPESGRLAPRLENVLWVAAARPDGSPVRGTVTVKLGDTTAVGATDEVGIAALRFRIPAGAVPAGADKVAFDVKLETTDGQTVERSIEVAAEPGEEDQVLLRLEQAVVRSGSSTKLQVRSTRRTGAVFLDVVQNRQTLLTRTLELRDGAADLDLAVPLETAGTLELHAYLLRRDGEFIRDSRVLLVEPANELRIDVSQDQPQYAPGEHAVLRFAVTDVAGRPKPAALGVILVDEAVYALQEMQPGLEKVYFLLEKEILTPRYELHFAPGGVSAEQAIQARDVPELTQKAALVLLAAAEPEPNWDLADNMAAERQVFRTQKLAAVYDALEKLGGLRGFDKLTDAEHPERIDDGALDAAVETGALAEDNRRGPSGRPIDRADLEALEGGLDAAALAPRVAWWGVLHTWRLIGLWAAANDAWCPGEEGWEGEGLFCIPDDILTQLRWDRVPGIDGHPRFVDSGDVLRDPWGHRYVVRRARQEQRWNCPDYSLGKIEVLSRGPDGELDTPDDIRWNSLGENASAPAGEYGAYLQRAAAPQYEQALTATEQEWEAKIDELLEQRMDRRWDRAWRGGALRRRAGGAMVFDMAAVEGAGGGGWGGPVPAAMPAGMPVREETAALTGSTSSPAAPGEPPARIREYFPETLLWAPEVITDADGKAEVQLDMADSITSWRMSVLASSADGALGSRDHGITVFQPFFVDIDLPVALTQNDQISLPIALYNYLDQAQEVELELVEGSWFAVAGSRKLTVRLQPHEVTARFFRITAKAPGKHQLTVYARGERKSDAIRRDIRVEPDGVPVETTFSDSLVGEISHDVALPPGAIPGSEYLEVKVYPGAFAQAVENLDSMLRMPGGCFEQTSSSTYPNLLVLDYLKRTETITPEIRMKAEQYVQLGYQRLLTFECQGGGFEWFGNTPAHLVLTAYGLREFVDMKAVYPVDEAVIERTRRFLLGKQQADGSWALEQNGIAEGAINRQQGSVVNTTAYITWSLIAAGETGAPIDKARAFLSRKLDAGIEDPYTLGLLLQVFAGASDRGPRNKIVEKLAALARRDEDGGVHWASEDASAFGSTGDVGAIEATALIALGLLDTGLQLSLAQGALDWLIRHKDSLGNWSSTQATIMTLKALIQSALAGNREVRATVQVIVNGEVLDTIEVTPETADVMRVVDATAKLKPGRNVVTVASSLAERAGLMSQVTLRSYVPWPAERVTPAQPLVLTVDYDRRELATGDKVKATVTAEYRFDEPAENVILDLGIPPGFDVATEDLDAAVRAGKIARFELTGRQIIVYVARLVPGQKLTFDVHFTARFPLRAQAPRSRAYLYYDPDVNASTRPVDLTVADAPAP
ncbi:MAG: hypothetical protein GYA57_04345 [Myxococcales bacterium]|nr:hypothetical protein [Myxococcales bacterium]